MNRGECERGEGSIGEWRRREGRKGNRRMSPYNKYMMYYNCRCEPAPIFVPGDKVWLDGSDITTN
jgi:hypothetical protein